MIQCYPNKPFSIVVIVQLQQLFLCFSTLRRVWRQKAAMSVATAWAASTHWPPVNVTLTRVTNGTCCSGSKVEHTCNRLGHRADHAFAKTTHQTLSHDQSKTANYGC